MKILLITLFCILSLDAISQTNNTVINDANSITINSGNITVGKIILTTAPGSQLFFKSFSQLIDTGKLHKDEYKTVFNLIPPNGVIVGKIITLIFDKPVISCAIKPVGNGAGMVSSASNKERTGYRFVIGQYECSELQIIIYSKEKIFTKIDGLTGQATQ